MLGVCLLIKKGIMLCNKAIQSLIDKKNIYNLDCFDIFIQEKHHYNLIDILSKELNIFN